MVRIRRPWEPRAFPQLSCIRWGQRIRSNPLQGLWETLFAERCLTRCMASLRSAMQLVRIQPRRASSCPDSPCPGSILITGRGMRCRPGDRKGRPYQRRDHGIQPTHGRTEGNLHPQQDQGEPPPTAGPRGTTTHGRTEGDHPRAVCPTRPSGLPPCAEAAGEGRRAQKKGARWSGALRHNYRGISRLGRRCLRQQRQ